MLPALPEHHLQPLGKQLPAPLFFRAGSTPAKAVFPWHCHAGGEFIYSYTGVVEVTLEGGKILSPPHYGVWLAPYAMHTSRTYYGATHCSLYISLELCAAMPQRTCALMLNPLVLAILEYLHHHVPPLPLAEEDERLLRVLLHHLGLAPIANSYLPSTDDPLLGKVLQEQEANPADNRTLAQLAKAVHTTERTLARRCQSTMGLSFSQWRQRLRVVKALSLLEQGWSVEATALEMGYASSSAFIAMFRRLMGTSPAEFRKGITR